MSKRKLNRQVSACLIGIATLCLPALCRAQGYTITTVAGGATSASGSDGLGDGGPATKAVLENPSGVAVDSAGNIYIADTTDDLIRKVSPSGIISTIAGTPGAESISGYAGDGGPATSAILNGPTGVALDTAGNIYIADSHNGRIRKIDTQGIITTVAGGGSSLPNGVPATSAAILFPTGIALDSSGNLYTTDSGLTVTKVSTSGIITTVVGGTEVLPPPSNFGDGGMATNASLSGANGIAVDASGNLYIADSSHNRVRKVSTSGIITTVAGSNSGSYSGDGGPATQAGLDGPTGVTVDSTGNLYITDTGDYRVRMVTPDGTITTIAGNGDAENILQCCTGDGGPATAAEFYLLGGVAVSVTGGVYVTDYSVIRLLTPNSPPSALVPTITLVQNAEGASATIAPNTWVAIKGSGLAPAGDTRIWLSSDFVNDQMPTQLDGVGVTMNGENAYVYYISPTQLNVLTPPDLAAGPVQVAVTTGGVTSASFTDQAQQQSLSFFIFGAGPYVIGTHLNGTDLGPTSLYPGLTTPAAPGETVVLYGNGFGPISPPVVAGSEVQSGSLPILPEIQIGGVSAFVQFAGLVSPGLYQFNVVVPDSTPSGDNAITATYNGSSTQAGTMLTVEP